MARRGHAAPHPTQLSYTCQAMNNISNDPQDQTVICQVTSEWHLLLEQPYQHRIEDNSLILWTKGRSIIAASFRLPPELSRDELLARLKSRPSAGILDVYESVQDNIYRLAFLQSETLEKDQSRLAMHTFTISRQSCLQVGFYFDLPADVQWAKQTWDTVSNQPLQEELHHEYD